jgi:hypothetical protein
LKRAERRSAAMPTYQRPSSTSRFLLSSLSIPVRITEDVGKPTEFHDVGSTHTHTHQKNHYPAHSSPCFIDVDSFPGISRRHVHGGGCSVESSQPASDDGVGAWRCSCHATRHDITQPLRAKTAQRESPLFQPFVFPLSLASGLDTMLLSLSTAGTCRHRQRLVQSSTAHCFSLSHRRRHFCKQKTLSVPNNFLSAIPIFFNFNPSKLI